jgi:hypothetical protein
METEHNPVPSSEYVESYGSTQYQDDTSLAIGCGVVAVIVLFLTIVGLVTIYV